MTCFFLQMCLLTTLAPPTEAADPAGDAPHGPPSESPLARILDAVLGPAGEDDDPVPVGRPGYLLRHGVDAAFSPDGSKIVTAGEDSAAVWDAATFKPLGPLMRHDGKIYTARFSPDGKMILTTSAVDGTAKVWEVGTGKLLATLPHGSVFGATFSPDGSRVITTNNNGPAHVWDLSKAKRALIVGDENAVLLARYSPDGKRILTSGHVARVWDATTGKPLLPPLSLGREDWGGPAAFSPDGTRIVSVNYDDTHTIACVWDASTGALLAKTPDHRMSINSIDFNRDGSRFVTTTNGYVRVWETGTGKAITPPMGDNFSRMDAAAFSPDGKLIVATGEGAQSALWDVTTGKCVSRLYYQTCTNAHFSPDGRRFLVTCYEEQMTVVFDVGPAIRQR